MEKSSSSDFSKIASKAWEEEEERQRLARELNDTHKILMDRQKKIEHLEKALAERDDKIEALKKELEKQKEDFYKETAETLKKRDKLIETLKKELMVKEEHLEAERNKSLWQFLFKK